MTGSKSRACSRSSVRFDNPLLVALAGFEAHNRRRRGEDTLRERKTQAAFAGAVLPSCFIAPFVRHPIVFCERQKDESSRVLTIPSICWSVSLVRVVRSIFRRCFFPSNPLGQPMLPSGDSLVINIFPFESKMA